MKGRDIIWSKVYTSSPIFLIQITHKTQQQPIYIVKNKKNKKRFILPFFFNLQASTVRHYTYGFGYMGGTIDDEDDGGSVWSDFYYTLLYIFYNILFCRHSSLF